MPSYNLKRFSNPKALKSVGPQTLGHFLSPYREFLKRKGFILPTDCSTLSDFDYLSLTAILMTPDEGGMPEDLMDALFFTHEMATDRTMDDLLEVANRIEILIQDESTPLDVAMRIWVRDPYALERAHACRHIMQARTFQHYQAMSAVAFVDPSEDKLSLMEAALDSWFIDHKRGGSSRVFVYPAADEVWFLIRHGDPFKRESTVKGYKSKGLLFRPETFDVACYIPSLGELRIHAKSKGMRDLYCRELGKLIAGDQQCFPGYEMYTLRPILEDGDRALYCKDVPGIDWIILSSLSVRRPAILAKSYRVDYSGPNVFLIFMTSDEKLKDHDRLEKAKFTVKFSDSDKPRSVTVCPPNRVTVCRDSDTALVESWLRKRGFVIGVRAEYEETDGLLASM